MNSELTNNVKKAIDETANVLSDEFVADIKRYFENNFNSLLNSKLELSIVIDMNAILADAEALVQKGESFLLELMKSPFLKFYAPDYLEIEIKKKIPEYSKLRKLDTDTFEKAINTIKSNIIIGSPDPESLIVSSQLLESIDVKDVDYYAMHLTLNTNGILTKDKHLTKIPELRTWKRPGELGSIVRVFKRGTLSFVILGRGIPAVLKSLASIFMIILKGICEVVKHFLELASMFITGAIKTISELPEWVQIALGIVTIILLINKESREAIMKFIKDIAKAFMDFLEIIYLAIKPAIEFITKSIEYGIIASSVLFEEVQSTIINFRANTA